MAKLTLLELCQDISSDMNDDEFNSINDTPTALQIAQIVKSTYFDLIGNKNWPHLRELIQLDASGDNNKPTHMKVPELIKEVEWIKYNKRDVDDTRDKFEDVSFLHPDEFINLTNGYDNSKIEVDLITDFSGVVFNIKNDEAPTFWTSFDDEYIVFNAYDNEVDTTLQSVKIQALAFREPSWSVADGFIPDLPSEAFPALLAEAKSACFLRLKQMPDQKAEQQSQRQRNWLSRKSWKAAGGIRFSNYGRKSLK